MSLTTAASMVRQTLKRVQPRQFLTSIAYYSNDSKLPSEDAMIPPYEERTNEPLEQRRARLLYQSRKRGMLENGLLLSTFAAKYLKNMNEEEMKQYDRLINLPSNDWDIYYWATGVKPTPEEFDNEVMNLFKEHIRNKERTMRIRQPDLEFS